MLRFRSLVALAVMALVCITAVAADGPGAGWNLDPRHHNE